MTLATLAEVLQPALLQGYAVPGFVCLGWEDARAFALAGQAERAPVILQAGPGAREHMPVAVWGSMFRALADSVDVPVVAHLDHGQSLDDCRAALDAGFTSLMFDGSRLPLSRNIEETGAVAVVARSAGVSCEGEVGFVGYSGGATSTGTDPEEAARFCRETGVDALAISIGNLHLQEQACGGLDLDRLRLIEGATPVPLVLHGGSGVPVEERARIAATSRICKVNIGTELRMIFGTALRTALSRAPEAYDRISLLRATGAPLQAAAMAILRNLGASGRV